MERTRFLQHYRVRVRSDGSPYEVDRNGAAVTYEAVDERTAEPVSLKLIPVQSIDAAVREQFEEQISTAQKLRHVNIAKVFDFGREGSDFVYVSEHLPGETLAAWVRGHGPMRADAALRVAEQIVSVLSSASFHKLPYPCIQPSDVMIVPGQTPEGTWPLIKLTNFGLPAVRSDRESIPIEAAAAGAEDSGSAEQLATAPSDIRSEIFSLGATLYFLLTGVALSADATQGTPKLSRFPKPLRTLLARMLHRDPDQRPRDLVVLAEMIRQSLLKIERRRAFADKYGIPYRTTLVRRPEARSTRLWRIGLPVAALLLAAAVIVGVLLAEPISRIMHRDREAKDIGVLIGVPESSPPQAASRNVATANTPATMASQGANAAVPVPSQSTVNAASRNVATANTAATVASQGANAAVPVPSQSTVNAASRNVATANTAATVASQGANAAMPVPSQSTVNAATASNSPQVASSDVQQPQTTNVEPQATAPMASETASPAAVAESSSSAAGETESPSKSDEATQPATASQSSSHSKKKSVASTSRRAGSVRGRVVGITSDGRLIFRLPSGRTAIVAPDSDAEEFVPRRHRRAMIDRDEMFAPPPQFERDYFPND